MAYTEALHKRGTGAQGGQFVTKGAGGQTTKTSSIGYSGGAGKGTGYGAKGGDPNVKSLQTELNRLGILDSQGKQLKVDGKFGPKTTAAVRRLQARLGMTVDGKITPALLAKIKKLKPSQHDQHAMHVRHQAAQHKQHAAHEAHQKHAAHQKTMAPAKKIAPARKATTAKKTAKPKARTGMGSKPVRLAPRAGQSRDTVNRSVGYSRPMTDMERHQPGHHNQASHGNRLGNIKAPSLGIGKKFHEGRKGTDKIHVSDRVKITGDISPSLARLHKGHTARVESFLGEGSRVQIRFEHDDSPLAVHPRDLQVVNTAEELNDADLKALDEGHDYAHQLKLKGPRKAVTKAREFTDEDVQKILVPNTQYAFAGGASRKTEDHIKLLKDAGATDDQAHTIAKGLGLDPERPWETKDVAPGLFYKIEDQKKAKAEADRTAALAQATPKAYEQLLGEGGQPPLVKSKRLQEVFQSMRAAGWLVTAASGHGSYAFSSADGSRRIQIIAINGVKIYDERHNPISGTKALALIGKG